MADKKNIQNKIKIMEQATYNYQWIYLLLFKIIFMGQSSINLLVAYKFYILLYVSYFIKSANQM